MASQPVIGSSVEGPSGEGKLLLRQVLGAGAFGIVFEGVAQSGARFAVKFLQTGVLADSHERQALFNEVMAAAQVSHPNVVRVVRVSEPTDEFAPYLVTEFVDSGTLHERITSSRKATNPFPLELIKAWSLEISRAMGAVNEKVLHRDLKPDNILLSGDTIKIADFGLAKLLGAPTRPVTFKGGQHLLYMAPEAWEGQRNEIQVDMYSSGLILYEIATLTYPYAVPGDPGDLDAFRRMHLFEVPKSPRAIRQELPQRFSEVISRLLSKRPESRYAAWADVTTALEASFDAASANPEANSVIHRLVETAHTRHQRYTASVLAEQEERQRQGEEGQLDKLQSDEILERFRSFVRAFNERTEGHKAAVIESGRGSFEIRFPYARPGSLSFFTVSPPLEMSPFTVRYAALIANGDGCGFNLLLRRRGKEQYGQWVVCRVRVSPLVDYRHPNCQYFGLPPSQFHDIQAGLRAMHTYVPELSEDLDASLEAFLESLFHPPRNGA